MAARTQHARMETACYTRIIGRGACLAQGAVADSLNEGLDDEIED